MNLLRTCNNSRLRRCAIKAIFERWKIWIPIYVLAVAFSGYLAGSKELIIIGMGWLFISVGFLCVSRFDYARYANRKYSKRNKVEIDQRNFNSVLVYAFFMGMAALIFGPAILLIASLIIKP